jgi:hypothetical protein
MRLATVIGFAGATFIMICLGQEPAHASDHWNLEEQLPTEVEDAYPSDYLVPELQSLFRYERLRPAGDRFVLSPRLTYGFARDWNVKIAAPFLLGPTDHTGSGDTEVDVFNNFVAESPYWPALAWSAGAVFPTGGRSDGIDTMLKFIATKALGTDFTLHRVHLNLTWNHHAGTSPEERRDRYTAILGYSHLLPTDTVLVADLVREQELEKTRTANLVEVGLRHMLTTESVVSVGAGAGLGSDSPRFRLTIGFQYSF